jgi:hypothetical protein
VLPKPNEPDLQALIARPGAEPDDLANVRHLPSSIRSCAGRTFSRRRLGDHVLSGTSSFVGVAADRERERTMTPRRAGVARQPKRSKAVPGGRQAVTPSTAAACSAGLVGRSALSLDASPPGRTCGWAGTGYSDVRGCAYGWYCSSIELTVSMRTRSQKRRCGDVAFASWATVVLVEQMVWVRTVTCALTGTRNVSNLWVSSRV